MPHSNSRPSLPRGGARGTIKSPVSPVAAFEPRLFPSTLTLLPTYRCTAACENCCFDSHPGVEGRIPVDRLTKYVDQAAAMGTVRTVVLSGGEAFLLGNDLDAVVARAKSHKLRSRIVTNGYWAVSPRAAHARLSKLSAAGLDELNLSTGDYHVKFVPLERVIWGARAGIDLGMSVVIVVERRAHRKVLIDDLRSDPIIREVLEDPELCARLTLLDSPWMARGDAVHGQEGRKIEPGPPVLQETEDLLTRANLSSRRGCESVLNTLVITPHETVGACCGLPREEIPELNLGSVREKGLRASYEEARTDFLKQWLAVEGPEHILAWAASHDPTIEWEGRYGHQCESCRAVYKDPKVAAVIRQHHREKLPDVLLQFTALERATSAAPSDEQEQEDA